MYVFELSTISFQALQDGKKENSGPRVIVGICAMGKKTMSKPMKEILSRLDQFEYIETIIFPEDIIVNVRLVFLIHFLESL